MPVSMTLVFPQKNGKVLLGMKKRGFGAGRYNGFGGKLEKGETPIQAAHREFTQESGLVANSLKFIGSFNFIYDTKPDWLHVYVYLAEDFSGEITETEEMKPIWFAKDDLPLDKMWPDDKYWLPAALDGKVVSGSFEFTDINTIRDYRLEIG